MSIYIYLFIYICVYVYVYINLYSAEIDSFVDMAMGRLDAQLQPVSDIGFSKRKLQNCVWVESAI